MIFACIHRMYAIDQKYIYLNIDSSDIHIAEKPPLNR